MQSAVNSSLKLSASCFGRKDRHQDGIKSSGTYICIS